MERVASSRDFEEDIQTAAEMLAPGLGSFRLEERDIARYFNIPESLAEQLENDYFDEGLLIPKI